MDGGHLLLPDILYLEDLGDLSSRMRILLIGDSSCDRYTYEAPLTLEVYPESHSFSVVSLATIFIVIIGCDYRCRNGKWHKTATIHSGLSWFVHN